MMPTRLRNNQDGMVLLLVLVVVALLTSLLTEFAFSTLVDLRLTETYRDATRAYYLAKGGVRAGRMLLQDDTNNHDSLDELWSQGVSGYPVADGTVNIHIEDQGGKLDLNRVYDPSGLAAHGRYMPMVERLFDVLDLNNPSGLADALLDWIDPDDSPEQDGAEDQYYLRLDPPYECKNAKLDSLDELALIKGFTPEIIAKLRPHVTVHGGDDKININTATAEVLMAVPAPPDEIDQAAAEDIIDMRTKQPFTTATLPEVQNISGLQALYLVPFDVKSPTYRIESWAVVNDGYRRVEAVIEKSGDKTLYLKVN